MRSDLLGAGRRLAAAPLLAVSLAACDRDAPEPAAPRVGEHFFTDVTAAVGLELHTRPVPDGTYHLPEAMTGGVALFDYDGDGDLDLLHVRAPPFDRADARAPNRLYRQEPDGTFADVTETSGLGDPGFGQGAAVGDVDNDGDPDVYVSNYGPDAFYRNNGDGTFSEETVRSGFSDDHWSASATFCDYDGDEHLDLYVTRYLQYDRELACPDVADRFEYCGPQNFHGQPDTLYRNDGDGTFTDVTQAAGVVLPEGGRIAKGLGVICADLTGDGLADFYVANDGESNQLWVNRGDGTFVDEAIVRGVAVNRHGKTEASMGVAMGDVNGDGHPDLLLTHLFGEYNTLYLGSDGPLFHDRTRESRLALYDIEFTGFGCAFLDFDHDGDLDLAVANGAIKRRAVQDGAKLGEFWNEYGETNFLFENDGNGVFTPAGDRGGSFTREVEVSRALALGDLDNDGDLDIVISNLGNSLRVYKSNASQREGHWLVVRALAGPRDALGAEITVRTADGEMRRLVLPGASYMASNDPRAHFGLGAFDRYESLVVVWPDGRREEHPGGPANRHLTIRQGGEGT